ncbi:aminotransferase class V-fold PLP-dependent enzyme [Massilia forsythiae]|uniref:cysteine desulfurase n=1 Tax=Massilia forsythiae TaxID=2728020 RepID=A0A7Z2VZ70_9BURK|nr:aminotransferase class V-fold PLP-dependent enzyme [Massilia forsythiae]QJE01580.1 aminotransferase class V-fold PLP-dependent enzyme [Massilia forsythiae]
MTDFLAPSRAAAPCRSPLDLPAPAARPEPPALPIYLDYAATTPVDPRVAQQMLVFMTEKFGNPASTSHGFGQDAAFAVAKARAQVAALVEAPAARIVWTSGATESNNLALKGAAHANRARGNHLVTVATEHKAVLDSMRRLESEGFEVTYLQPQANGLVDPAAFEAALRPDTILASVMMVNNEIGVIQPVGEFGRICRARGVLLHVDAAQAAGKLHIDVERLHIDLLSLSAHKLYGPKGIGALYVREGVRLEAQMDGGGHEQGLRSGTLPSHQIVGMGAACELARLEMDAEALRIGALRDRLRDGLAALPGVRFNGDLDRRIPHNLNVSFADCGPLAERLPDIAVSAGSACNSASAAPSYVLRALGLGDALARSAMRITLGRYTGLADVDHFLLQLRLALR